MNEEMRKQNARMAKFLALHCVRNTFLEDLHAGTVPSSKTGDYSDVKVVTPYGEIAWEDLSRISDEEMRRLMISIVNKLYTALNYYEGEGYLPTIPVLMPTGWNEPEVDQQLYAGLLKVSKSYGLPG